MLGDQVFIMVKGGLVKAFFLQGLQQKQDLLFCFQGLVIIICFYFFSAA